jgi:hypothetical protein
VRVITMIKLAIAVSALLSADFQPPVHIEWERRRPSSFLSRRILLLPLSRLDTCAAL